MPAPWAWPPWPRTINLTAGCAHRDGRAREEAGMRPAIVTACGASTYETPWRRRGPRRSPRVSADGRGRRACKQRCDAGLRSTHSRRCPSVRGSLACRGAPGCRRQAPAARFRVTINHRTISGPERGEVCHLCRGCIASAGRRRGYPVGRARADPAVPARAGPDGGDCSAWATAGDPGPRGFPGPELIRYGRSGRADPGYGRLSGAGQCRRRALRHARLKQSIFRQVRGQAKDVADGLYEDVRTFFAGAAQADDLTVTVIRRTA